MDAPTAVRFGSRVSGEVASVPRSRYPRDRTAPAAAPDAQTATTRPATVLEINYSALSALVSIVENEHSGAGFTPLTRSDGALLPSWRLYSLTTMAGRRVSARTATSGAVTARRVRPSDASNGRPRAH